MPDISNRLGPYRVQTLVGVIDNKTKTNKTNKKYARY